MAGSMKLVALIEGHAEQIARQWAKDAKKNPRTPSYHNITEDNLASMAARFYDNFGQMFYTDKPAEISRPYFYQYAEEHYRINIPLSEALYALILMRRHIWLYAEFQAIFISAVEQKQAVDSLIRTILMFDYAITFISQRYQELIRSEVDEKMGILNVILMGDQTRARLKNYKTAIMTALLLGVFALTTYSHSVVGTDVIFTHLFYIPIVLAGIWWQRKGIWIGLVLGLYLMASHLLFLKGMPMYDDLIRALMFIIIGVVVAFLSEGLNRAEGIFRHTILKGATLS
ncbi:MAG: hypothetical protein PHN75_02880 [Syntrophales bacterium]|nr:hypothetical protein [Syntrophales bacterium]